MYQWPINLDNIHIIMVRTNYPGNIGSAARAMMNFGMKNMILVDPQCEFTKETFLLARTASPIFENAEIVPDLESLLSRFDLLIGTSRRGADRLHMRMSPHLAAMEIRDRYSKSKIGIVFGDERSGLTNEDLKKCAFYIWIPSSPDFESLNLSHSIGILAYEIYQAYRDKEKDLKMHSASEEQVEYLTYHIESFLKAFGFPTSGSPSRVLSDVKRVLASASLKQTDTTLFHGFMRYMEDRFLGHQLPLTQDGPPQRQSVKRKTDDNQ